ncbi:MAG: YtxH domain-containing protein [Cellulomonadaceae bacterium]
MAFGHPAVTRPERYAGGDMKAKAAFVIGVGVGYLFGTAAGRQRFEKIKAQAGDVWHSEPVQRTVSDLQEKASDLAKNQGSAIVDKVTSKVGEAFGSGDDAKHAANQEPGPGEQPASPYGR